MTFVKNLLSVTIVFGMVALSGCGADEKLVADGDPPEVTCERLEDVFAEFRDTDLDNMGLSELLTQAGQAFSEIETIADETQDDQLGQSIDTLAETLNSSIAASGGDVDAVEEEFTERMEQAEVREAVTYVEATCDLEMPL